MKKDDDYKQAYRTIEEYISAAEDLFLNLEWRQITATSEDGCFIYKREWVRTQETLSNLLNNMEWARGIIRTMLKSPIPSEIKEAKDFISEIRYYKEFAFWGGEFGLFFSEWHMFYDVLEGDYKTMSKPMKMKTLPDTEKALKVDNLISLKRKMKIWETFKDSGYIDGDADDFLQLCDGYSPKGTLTWLKTNTGHNAGSFSGVSLIHFLIKLGVDMGEKHKHIRTAVCFFRKGDNAPLIAKNCNSYLQKYKTVKSFNPIINKIDLLFSKIDEAN
jgi:hypothetical protein